MELSGSEPTPEVTPATETPSPETPAEKIETPADPTPEAIPSVEVPALYDLPDGRKVDAETLSREFKENFLPEFTRKSQALAEIERKKDLNNSQDDIPEWKKDDYVPQNYAEVIELAKREALQEMQNASSAEKERILAVQTEVDSQILELKKSDPKLDENSLFVHANKYGFRDLKVAYSNMSDMKKALVDVEQRTVKNLKTRESDPISTGPGGAISEDSGYDPNTMSQFDGAAGYLEYVKGKK